MEKDDRYFIYQHKKPEEHEMAIKMTTKVFNHSN